MKSCKIYVVTLAALLLLACNNDEYMYNAQKAEAFQKEQFATSFISQFGEIPAGQGWDFAAEALTSITGAATRAAGSNITPCVPDNTFAYLDADGYYDIPATLQKSLNVIKENKDNSKLANNYAMSVPDNSFTIIPVRQGQTGSTYEVHMVVGSGENAVDYLLWEKGQLMQTRKAGTTGKWNNMSTKWESTTYGNYDVRTKVLTFKNMPVNEPMYFYLYRSASGLYPSSLEGYMKDFTSILNVPEQLLKDGKQVKIIGVEAQRDANWVDNDYEDVMFMIVGDPTLPGEIEKIEDLNFTQTISKRYMIEDLGESDDTDFNDIVVDVKASRSVKFEYEEATGRITNRTYGEWTNAVATIRHLGGTLPFKLRIGNTQLDWIDGQMNVDPNTVIYVSGWNPDTNNISVAVKQSEKDNSGASNISFPEKGSVPMIIATDTSQPWMDERVSIISTLKSLIDAQKTED